METAMARFVQSLKKHMQGEEWVALESCLGCKQCGSGCAWYLETGEACLHPTHKLNLLRRIYRRYLTWPGRVLGSLGLMPTPSVEEVRGAMESFWKCTACGRCSLACPLQLNNRSLVKLARTAYFEAGWSQENPTRDAIVANTVSRGQSYGLSREQIFLRVAYFLESLGLEVPFDVAGAEYLLLCPSVGNTHLPDYALKIPQLLNVAKVSYTLSSKITETGTEIDHIVGDRERAREILLGIEEEALRLGVRTLLLSECGCDVRTFMLEATQILGRELKVAVRTVDALLLELIENARLPVAPMEVSVTLHDPCYVTRLSGQGETIRRLLNQVALHFTEMSPNRELNYCCNGGSGPFRLQENQTLRRQVSRLKAEQIKATGAEHVVTPCAVCLLTLEDICRHYSLASSGQRKVFLLFELVYQASEQALVLRGEWRRFLMPALLAGKHKMFVDDHTMGKLVSALPGRPDFRELADWFCSDAVVRRFQAEHPQARTPETWIRTLKRLSQPNMKMAAA